MPLEFYPSYWVHMHLIDFHVNSQQGSKIMTSMMIERTYTQMSHNKRIWNYCCSCKEHSTNNLRVFVMCAGQAGEVFMANVFILPEFSKHKKLLTTHPKHSPTPLHQKIPCSLPIKPSTVMYMTSASHTQNNTAPNMVTPTLAFNEENTGTFKSS